MSEDEYRRENEEQGDEVEGHRHHFAGNDEGEDEGSEDVEAHVQRTSGPRPA